MEKLLIGFGGVVLGALLTVFRELFTEWRTKQSDSRYLAVRVTCILDRFISGCFEVSIDDGMPDEQGIFIPNSIDPKISFDDLDVRWQSLKFEVMYRLLDLPNRVIEARETWSNEWSLDSPPYYYGFYAERQYQHALLGIEAYELAAFLREKYSMAAPSHECQTHFGKFVEVKREYEAIGE